MAYDRDRYERDRYDRDRHDRERLERERADRERGMMERAGDEVRSWFGDDEARRRRERDEREREREHVRSYRPEQTYGDRDVGRHDRETRWSSEPDRTEGYRDYGDRYGRTYSAAIDRDREADRSPAFQPYARGAQEFGPEGYGSTRSAASAGTYAREWRSTETWRVPGPYVGRGPKGYQRSDERIREELSDRLTAHGLIDASDVELRVQGGEVTLTGFVDSREAKRAAEDVAEDVQGVREVHNLLRVRSHAGDTGVGRTSVLGLTERETQTAGTAKALDAREATAEEATRSRARNT